MKGYKVKTNKIKQIAANGLVSGKLKLGKVKRKPVGFFLWGMHGTGRRVLSDRDLEAMFGNTKGFARLRSAWDVNRDNDFVNTWVNDVDNTFLLKTSTKYIINILGGFIIIDSKKYRFEFDHNGINIDLDGDLLQTHFLHNNLVSRFGPRAGAIVYKEIKILGETHE